MSIYLIALTEPSDEIYEKTEKLGDAFRLTPTLYLAKPRIATPDSLQEQLGIRPNEEGAPSGLIIDMVKGLSVGVIPKAAADWYHGALENESKEKRSTRWYSRG